MQPEAEWLTNITNPNTRRAVHEDRWHRALHRLSHHCSSPRHRLAQNVGEKEHVASHDSPDSLRSLHATSVTNVLEHGADIAKVQKWLGHSDISIT